MKNLSISQRLFVLLAGLVAALVAAGSFDHVAQAREQAAGERRDAALRQAERIRYAMLGMGYGMRGLLVSATPEAEQKYKDEADEDFTKAVADARKIIGDRPDLLAALDEYIAEETGHEEWILNDIAAAGGDADQARASQPHPATRAMVDHAYARIRGGDPVAFFGMVYVLESVSVALASQGASAVAERLGLPPEAFTYLTSHGALDQSHMRFFANLVNGLNSDADRQSIIGMARAMFGLFGAMFAAIPLEDAHAPA